ncbi:MAG: carbohydrate binding domain-containing protein, partial [Actinobacteria bacterium]|nr:carbohydrate binding domain-containing protein [Actinomycetota bacterium]
MYHRLTQVCLALVPVFGVYLAVHAVAAAADATAVPLVNASFEQDLSGWSVSTFGQLIAGDTQVAHTGKSSARISDPAGESMPYATQVVHDLSGGATYTFRAWVRGDATEPHAAAALKIEGYTTDGRNTLGKYARLPVKSCSDWAPIAVTARFPPQVTRASLLLRLFGGGTIWFDDVEFVQDMPPPAVALGPERQTAQTGQRSVSFVAGLAKPWPNGEPPIRVSIRTPDGNIVSSEQVLMRGTEATVWNVTLTIPELAPGTYVAESRLGGALGQSATVFIPMPIRKPANLTDTGTILADGKPFFPIGVYHCSRTHYPMLAKAGFNCVQGSGPQSLEGFGQALDAAAAAGLMMDVPLYANGKVAANMPASIAGIERYAKHPAVLCWKIIDEPDARPEIADEVPDAYT